MTSYLQLSRGETHPAETASPQLSFFFLRRSFFEPSAHAAARMRWTGQIFWLLAYGVRTDRYAHLLPAFTARSSRDDWLMGSRIQLQQRNCSRFSRDFSRRSTDQTRKELLPEVAACASAAQDLFSQRDGVSWILALNYFPLCLPSEYSISTSRHRRRRLHRLQSDPRLAGEIPDGATHRDRRFSLRRFQESRRLQGDFVAADLATLDWREQFDDEKFDAHFSLASITDTTDARSIPADARQRGELSPPPEFRAAEQNARRLRLVRRRPTARPRRDTKTNEPRRPTSTPSPR